MSTISNSIKFFSGVIYHQRIGKIEHFFKNKINAILIDLKTKDYTNSEKFPYFFSIEKFNFLYWSSKDHGPRINNLKRDGLYDFIKNLVINSSKKRNEIDSIKLLTFPKILGYGFNPLSVYFCYDANHKLIHFVFEVRNTFGDMHHYVLDNVDKKGANQETKKKMFVSPFYEKKGHYNLYANYTKNQILTSVKYFISNKLIFSASMSLNELEFNNKNIVSSIITLKNFPGKIWINIHLQAFFLWLKKVELFKIPEEETIKFSFGKKILINKTTDITKRRKAK